MKYIDGGLAAVFPCRGLRFFSQSVICAAGLLLSLWQSDFEKKYNAMPAYLWMVFPDYAVFRHACSGKRCGIRIKVRGRSLEQTMMRINIPFISRLFMIIF